MDRVQKVQQEDRLDQIESLLSPLRVALIVFP